MNGRGPLSASQAELDQQTRKIIWERQPGPGTPAVHQAVEHLREYLKSPQALRKARTSGAPSHLKATALWAGYSTRARHLGTSALPLIPPLVALYLLDLSTEPSDVGPGVTATLSHRERKRLVSTLDSFRQATAHFFPDNVDAQKPLTDYPPLHELAEHLPALDPPQLVLSYSPQPSQQAFSPQISATVPLTQEPARAPVASTSATRIEDAADEAPNFNATVAPPAHLLPHSGSFLLNHKYRASDDVASSPILPPVSTEPPRRATFGGTDALPMTSHSQPQPPSTVKRKPGRPRKHTLPESSQAHQSPRPAASEPTAQRQRSDAGQQANRGRPRKPRHPNTSTPSNGARPLDPTSRSAPRKNIVLSLDSSSEEELPDLSSSQRRFKPTSQPDPARPVASTSAPLQNDMPAEAEEVDELDSTSESDAEVEQSLLSAASSPPKTTDSTMAPTEAPQAEGGVQPDQPETAAPPSPFVLPKSLFLAGTPRMGRDELLALANKAGIQKGSLKNPGDIEVLLVGNAPHRSILDLFRSKGVRMVPADSFAVQLQGFMRHKEAEEQQRAAQTRTQPNRPSESSASNIPPAEGRQEQRSTQRPLPETDAAPRPFSLPKSLFITGTPSMGRQELLTLANRAGIRTGSLKNPAEIDVLIVGSEPHPSIVDLFQHKGVRTEPADVFAAQLQEFVRSQEVEKQRRAAQVQAIRPSEPDAPASHNATVSLPLHLDVRQLADDLRRVSPTLWRADGPTPPSRTSSVSSGNRNLVQSHSAPQASRLQSGANPSPVSASIPASAASTPATAAASNSSIPTVRPVDALSRPANLQVVIGPATVPQSHDAGRQNISMASTSGQRWPQDSRQGQAPSSMPQRDRLIWQSPQPGHATQPSMMPPNAGEAGLPPAPPISSGARDDASVEASAANAAERAQAGPQPEPPSRPSSSASTSSVEFSDSDHEGKASSAEYEVYDTDIRGFITRLNRTAPQPRLLPSKLFSYSRDPSFRIVTVRPETPSPSAIPARASSQFETGSVLLPWRGVRGPRYRPERPQVMTAPVRRAAPMPPAMLMPRFSAKFGDRANRLRGSPLMLNPTAARTYFCTCQLCLALLTTYAQHLPRLHRQLQGKIRSPEELFRPPSGGAPMTVPSASSYSTLPASSAAMATLVPANGAASRSSTSVSSQAGSGFVRPASTRAAPMPQPSIDAAAQTAHQNRQQPSSARQSSQSALMQTRDEDLRRNAAVTSGPPAKTSANAPAPPAETVSTTTMPAKRSFEQMHQNDVSVQTQPSKNSADAASLAKDQKAASPSKKPRKQVVHDPEALKKSVLAWYHLRVKAKSTMRPLQLPPPQDTSDGSSKNPFEVMKSMISYDAWLQKHGLMSTADQAEPNARARTLRGTFEDSFRQIQQEQYWGKSFPLDIIVFIEDLFTQDAKFATGQKTAAKNQSSEGTKFLFRKVIDSMCSLLNMHSSRRWLVEQFTDASEDIESLARMLVAGKIPFTEGILSGYPGQERHSPVQAQKNVGSSEVTSTAAEASSSRASATASRSANAQQPSGVVHNQHQTNEPSKQSAQTNSDQTTQLKAQSTTSSDEPTDQADRLDPGNSSHPSHSGRSRLSSERPGHETDGNGAPQDNLPVKAELDALASADLDVDVKPSITQTQDSAKSPAVRPRRSRAREPSSSVPVSNSAGGGLVLRYPAEAVQQSQAIRRADPASSARRSGSASSLKPLSEARSASRSVSPAVAPKRRKRRPDLSSDEEQPPPQPRFRVIYKQTDKEESAGSSSSSEDEDAANDTIWYDPQDQQRSSRQSRAQGASNNGSLVMRPNGKLLPAALRPRSGATSTWRKSNEPATLFGYS